jgi:CRP-like cAMP-binding protein
LDNQIDLKQGLAAVFGYKFPLEAELLEALTARWTHKRSLRRADFLIEKGKTEQYLYYVQSGAMRLYYPHETEEICVGFAYADTLICSYPSFIQGEPSEYFIQAIRKTEIKGISRHDFYELLDQFPRLDRAWRMLTEEALLGKIRRETEMLAFSPEERLRRLWQRSPHIFQLIPRKYLASYLRMSPETLSRIRL